MDYDRRPSLKEKLRLSSCFSCCFRGGGGDPLSPIGGEGPAALLRSSSTWIRSKAKELPDLGDRCRSFVSRIRRPRHEYFSYDPVDYALNFDEGEDEEDAPLAPYHNFSSRLPATPPIPPPRR